MSSLRRRLIALEQRVLLSERNKRELSELGSVDDRWQVAYEPFESQEAFHSTTSRFKGFSGPVGSGKSNALCREALRLAYANPGRTGLIGAPTYPMLRDTTRSMFIETLEDIGLQYSLNKAENVITLNECGSQILFRALDVFERLRGTNLAWFGVDELTYCKPEAWQRLEARLRDPRARRLAGFAVWTPNGHDWVYRRFISHEDIGSDAYSATLAKPGENTALPEGFYEALKRSYSERFYRQEVLGEYLNIFSGQVYYAFDRKLNCKPLQFDPLEPVFWSLDFNVNPMASVIGQIVDGRVLALEELVLPDSNTREACEEFGERAARYRKAFSEKFKGSYPLSVNVYGDAAGEQRKSSADKTDWQIVREWFKRNDDRFRVNFRVPSSNPTQKARVNAVNSLLCNYAGERRLLIDPRCKDLVADLEQVAWKQGSSALIDKDRDPKRTHISDALGYAIDREFGLRMKGGERREYLGM